MTPPVGPIPARGSLGPVASWAVVALLAVVLAPLRSHAPSGHLDSSWGTVLWYARDHGLQHGTEIVFTYGPLGNTAVGCPVGRPCVDVWWFVMAITALALVPMAWLVRRLPWQPVAVLAVVLCGLPKPATGLDVLVPAGLLAWGVLGWVEEPTSTRPWCIGLALLAGLAALIKFTWLLTGSLTVLVVAADLVLRRRQAWAATLVTLTGGVFLAGWAAAGQHVANLPAYITNSLSIASGYAKAMGTVGPTDLFCAEVLAMALCVWTAVIGVREARLPAETSPAARRWLLGGWLACLFFLAWKHGVVRAAEGDMHHAMLAGWSVFCGFTLCGLRTDRAAVDHGALTRACVVALIAAVSVHRLGLGPLESRLVNIESRVASQVRKLAGHDERGGELERAWEERRRELALPTARSIVADGTVDVFGYLQDHAVANGMNYTPRPVFQSYSVYNRHLDELNERFFLGESAPHWALLSLGSIDGRFPPLEDAACLRAILRNYTMVGQDGPFLVMERRGGGACPLEQVAAGVGRIGERVAVEGHDAEDLWLEIDVSPSLWGRIESVVLRPAACSLRLWSDAPQDHGQVWNAPAVMLAAGFIASPVLAGPADVAAALANEPTRRLAAFTVESPARATAGTFRWRLFSIRDGVVGHPASRPAVSYPGFGVVPAACRSTGVRAVVDVAGTSMLMVGPPSAIEIVVPDEATAVEGRFAFVPAAYEEGATDGAEFTITMTSGEQPPRELSRRFLRPRERGEDRGVQQFSLGLPAGSDRRLVLETGAGPAANDAWDWTCWSDLRFSPSAPPAARAPDREGGSE